MDAPECCTKYKDHVFVFGSNEAGRHGAGAALHARMHHRAMRGCAVGIQGQAYAIPTKDARLDALPLHAIRAHVSCFLAYADRHPEKRFYVTRIGCGLARLRDEDMAPMFTGAPDNCVLPTEWREVLNGD